MKLTITHGESVENALEYLREFLGQFKGEYPFLKGNMNIYVQLEGKRHTPCPENDRELVLSGELPEDREQQRKDKALAEVRDVWKRVIAENASDIKEIQYEIRLDKKYLATAHEKNRRPDLIEKRKKLKETHEGEMYALTDRYLLLDRFNKALDSGHVKTVFMKNQRSRSQYNYSIECYLVFENIDGLNGYCDKYGFKTGLPYFYENK